MARVRKTQPTSSSVHVPSPPQKGSRIPPSVERPEVTILKAAFGGDLTGGRAEGMRPEDFDLDQLLRGVATEMEHTDDYQTALQIAMDHLSEFPDYYTHLEKMEAGLEGVEKNAPLPNGNDMTVAMAAFAGDRLGKPGLVADRPGTVEKRMRIAKRDRARQIVYGVVLVPEEVDIQADTITADEIEKTAHQYLARSRIIGENHTRQMDAHVVESYIAPCDIVYKSALDGEQVVPRGSWILAVKVSDPKEWAKVERGDYEGFSVGGEGLRDKVN